MRKIIITCLIFFTANVTNAMDITSDQFEELKIKFQHYKKGVHTLPLVLIYDLDGQLIKTILGQDISKYESYEKSQLVDVKLDISSLPLNEMLKVVGLEQEKKLTIIYVGMEICPPCFTILEQFNSKVRPKIESKFRIIPLNFLVN